MLSMSAPEPKGKWALSLRAICRVMLSILPRTQQSFAEEAELSAISNKSKGFFYLEIMVVRHLKDNRLSLTLEHQKLKTSLLQYNTGVKP